LLGKTDRRQQGKRTDHEGGAAMEAAHKREVLGVRDYGLKDFLLSSQSSIMW
jgi:hypothetical protein